MVFNPTLESGIRFDQPVQQPTSPVANIVQGLGIFNRREAAAPSSGDRYDAAVASYREATDAPGVADWTEQHRRGFAEAYPQFADRPYGTANEGIDLQQNAITLEEQMGGAGYVSERERRDNQVSWYEGPMGIAARNTGNQMFDGDETQVEAYVAEQYALHMITAGQAARLAQDTELMTNRTAYSQAAWDVYEDQFYAVSINTVSSLAPFMERLAAGDTVNFSEIPGFAELMGVEDGRINANNISTIFSQYRHRLVQQMTGMMRDSDIANAAGAPRIGQPDSDYMDRILAPIDNLISAFESSDPNAALERATSAATLTMYSNLGPQERAGIALLGLVSENEIASSQIMGVLEAGGFTQRALQALTGTAQGDTGAALTPEEADEMSVPEASATVSTAVTLIHEHIGSGSVDADTLQGLFTTLSSASERANSEIDPSVYSGLFTADAISAMSGSRAATEAFSQFIQVDIANDWDDLRQMVGGQFGGITFDGTRLVYTPVGRETDVGGALGSSRLSRDAQDLLQTINEKLGIIQSTGIGEAFGDSPEAFFEALTTGMNVQGGTGRPETELGLEGQERSVANLETWTNIYNTAPQGATEVYSDGRVRAYSTPGMSPITTLEGASHMTHSYAESNMAQVLAGPFAALQERFGAAITINDAIAREGTTRETETPGSRHFHGDALDINIAGMSPEDQMRLVQEATAVGFQGFGFGNGILHIDLGERRSWSYGNETFAGVPVADMQELVANGTVPRPELLSGGAGANVHPNVLAMLSMPQGGTTETDQLEFDLNEGVAQGMSYYDRDPATVDQAPVGELSVGDNPNVEPSASEQGMPTAARRGNPQLERLIDELSGEIDTTVLDDGQIEDLRILIAERLGLVPRQRPEGG